MRTRTACSLRVRTVMDTLVGAETAKVMLAPGASPAQPQPCSQAHPQSPPCVWSPCKHQGTPGWTLASSPHSWAIARALSLAPCIHLAPVVHSVAEPLADVAAPFKTPGPTGQDHTQDAQGALGPPPYVHPRRAWNTHPHPACPRSVPILERRSKVVKRPLNCAEGAATGLPTGSHCFLGPQGAPVSLCPNCAMGALCRRGGPPLQVTLGGQCLSPGSREDSHSPGRTGSGCCRQVSGAVRGLCLTQRCGRRTGRGLPRLGASKTWVSLEERVCPSFPACWGRWWGLAAWAAPGEGPARGLSGCHGPAVTVSH